MAVATPHSTSGVTMMPTGAAGLLLATGVGSGVADADGMAASVEGAAEALAEGVAEAVTDGLGGDDAALVAG
ncbi:hypothetical protein D6T63_11360 [Arthrobacter cheniae]|uniref:Uncharacterized protein n=1 Tax=Arthrobacter cheniae TaxID=1258888 RepID=A0A3A5M5B8_9MICC|nr:hypothetical protein D6T63_11360 [Arthrobacter cheniae]